MPFLSEWHLMKLENCCDTFHELSSKTKSLLLTTICFFWACPPLKGGGQAFRRTPLAEKSAIRGTCVNPSRGHW
jgi:hypothetical protein